MTQTFDELVATNFNTSSCYTVHDLAGLNALPDGTRFRDNDGDEYVVKGGKKRPYRNKLNGWKWDATMVLDYLPFEILNPEVLGEFDTQADPDFDELLGKFAQAYRAACALVAAAEDLLGSKPEPEAVEEPPVDWFDSLAVGDRVNVIYGGGWDGPGTVTLVNGFRGSINVKLEDGLAGGFFRNQVEPLFEAVDVKIVEERTPQVGDRVRVEGFDPTIDGKCGEVTLVPSDSLYFGVRMEHDNDAWLFRGSELVVVSD